MNRDLSKMSLANAYRPRTFDQMIGQDHVVNILKAQMEKRESVFHNYLLFGPRGTGKTTSARLIAKGLNCLNLQNGNPCNECNNCKLIDEGTSLDYVEIDAASHTGVENIREEIIEKSIYPPTALKKKIYIIDEVHMLSGSAFNALLKTIEEPKANVCFILATTEIHKVPETIVSRCQVFNFKKVDNSKMIAHLQTICEKEQLQYTPEALAMLANISEGCVRDAIKYLDQMSVLGVISEENISKFLGIAGESTIKAFLEILASKERNLIFEQIDKIAESGIDLGQFAKQSIHFIDQHLLENIDFYLAMAQMLGNASELMKRHPYPVIAYKIAINNFLTNDKTSHDPSFTTTRNTATTRTTTATSSPTVKDISPKVDPIPTVAQIPTQTTADLKEQKPISNTPEQIISQEPTPSTVT